MRKRRKDISEVDYEVQKEVRELKEEIAKIKKMIRKLERSTKEEKKETVEKEEKVVIKKKIPDKKECPNCGAVLKESQLPFGALLICETGCGFREVRKV